MPSIVTFACSGPVFFKKRTPLKPKDVRRAIQQAQMICYNFEDTPQCRVAWEKVEELSSELARQREEALVQKAMCEEDPESCKDYEV
jgi:hypothetical protein